MPEPMLLWHWLACCGFQFPCSGLQMVFRQLSSDSNWMLASSPKHCFCVAISPEGKREAHTAYKAQKACIPSFTRLFYQFVPAVRAAVGRRFSTQLSEGRELQGCSLRESAPCWRELIDDIRCLGDTHASINKPSFTLQYATPVNSLVH